MPQLNTRYNQILGGLYGQAMGDAWGKSAWFRPEMTWALYDGWLEKLAAPPVDHPIHGGMTVGQVTDDTEQAMALADVLIRDGKISVATAAEAVVRWYDQIDGDNSPYVGPSTRRAVEGLKAGADPNETGRRGDTNGGAMRISPIGLIHPGDPTGAVEDAIIACTPTHFADVGLSGACAVAAAVAQALMPNTSLDQIIGAAKAGAVAGRERGSSWLGASVERKIDMAVELATDEGVELRQRIQNLYDLIGATLATGDSVPCAFGVLVMAKGDPTLCAIYATALSGDADTIGAIACAIAGAWQGIEALPEEVIEQINRDNPQYDFVSTAQGLHQLAERIT